jgi:hypothetical protein
MQEYIKKIPQNIKKIKIDIGLSYNAPHSVQWFNHDKDELFIFGFEPNPECIDNIYNGTKTNKPIPEYYLSNNYCLIPVALDNVNTPENRDFYQMLNDCGTSSLYYPINKNLGLIKDVIKVPVYSLKNFFDLFEWDRFPYIEYIKIDAQGADLNILMSAGDYLKDRVVFITAEPENTHYINISHNTEINIQKYLETQGFIYIKHPNTHDPTFINSKFTHLINDIFIFQR